MSPCVWVLAWVIMGKYGSGDTYCSRDNHRGGFRDSVCLSVDMFHHNSARCSHKTLQVCVSVKAEFKDGCGPMITEYACHNVVITTESSRDGKSTCWCFWICLFLLTKSFLIQIIRRIFEVCGNTYITVEIVWLINQIFSTVTQMLMVIYGTRHKLGFWCQLLVEISQYTFTYLLLSLHVTSKNVS